MMRWEHYILCSIACFRRVLIDARSCPWISRRFISCPQSPHSNFPFSGKRITPPISGESSKIAEDTWYNIGVIFDGSETGNDRIKSYINSELQSPSYSSTPPTSTFTGSQSEHIGKYPFTALDYFSDGKISNFYIYENSITSNDWTSLNTYLDNY